MTCHHHEVVSTATKLYAVHSCAETRCHSWYNESYSDSKAAYLACSAFSRSCWNSNCSCTSCTRAGSALRSMTRSRRKQSSWRRASLRSTSNLLPSCEIISRYMSENGVQFESILAEIYNLSQTLVVLHVSCGSNFMFLFELGGLFRVLRHLVADLSRTKKKNFTRCEVCT